MTLPHRLLSLQQRLSTRNQQDDTTQDMEEHSSLPLPTPADCPKVRFNAWLTSAGKSEWWPFTAPRISFLLVKEMALRNTNMSMLSCGSVESGEVTASVVRFDIMSTTTKQSLHCPTLVIWYEQGALLIYPESFDTYLRGIHRISLLANCLQSMTMTLSSEKSETTSHRQHRKVSRPVMRTILNQARQNQSHPHAWSTSLLPRPSYLELTLLGSMDWDLSYESALGVAGDLIFVNSGSIAWDWN